MPPAIPQLALRNATVTFGGRPLFADITMNLGKGERVCLVGANGSGKSTILKILAGEAELDAGERFVQPGVTIGSLPQNPDFSRGGAVAAYVGAGLPDPEAEQYKIDAALDHLSLDGARDISTLSGGEGRRAALARVLVSAPDILLLDEPTNHLDLPTIEWLEEELASFSGGILMISHDRAFLTKLTKRLLWLDRGRMFEMDGGFAQFEEWSNGIIEQEAAEGYRLKKRLEQEEYWLQRGVTARRSRNEGRRRNLFALRKQRAEALKARGTAKLALSDAEASGQIVCEAISVTKRFQRPDDSEVTIVDNFSTRIQRGDRVGLIGPNGAGKSTLLKLLTGQAQPDSGTIKLGTNLLPLYLDQRRTVFDLDKTLWQTLAPGGGDSITVRGQQRHVVAYLRDFLFSDKQATMTVRTLSGGERARLMMARLFAQPSNLIVLDEPTNDLDMDTLDLLEEVLEEYDGTLLLVSHDRDFLDRLVTSIIAVEGEGDVSEYPGGYSDYLIQRPASKKAETKKADMKAAKKPAATPTLITAGAALRFSSKEQRELDELPARMATLEKEIAVIEKALGNPDLYAKDAQKFAKASDLLAVKKDALLEAEFRWLELDEKRASLAAS